MGKASPTIDRKIVWVLAIVCAMTVANLYYVQPLLADIGKTFAASESSVGFIATVTQLGYALGLLLIVPLGDSFNRRELITGVILLDLGTQGTHISNQTRIYRLNAAARGRLNTVYMVSYFIGGSLGSLLGAYGWSIGRRNGVCAVSVLMLVAALVVYTMGRVCHSGK